MPRVKGSGLLGVVRSLRLPLALDEWFEKRLCQEPQRSASDMLLELVHGGLRLRRGYMERHRAELEAYGARNDAQGYGDYRRALEQTFGLTYVEHLERWLQAGADERATQPVDKNTVKTR